MKKYLALTFILSFFASLALIACSYDAGNPPQAPHLGAIAAIQFAGDLDGSYVSQTVVGLQNNPLPAPAVGALQYDGGSLYWGAVTSVGHGTAGQVLATNDAGAATTWVYPHGDVDASAADPGDLTVNAIQGYGVSASVPTAGNQLRWSGSLWGPAALNLAGGSGYVTGTLPTANQAAQTMTGDVTGTTAANTVTQAQGGAVTFTSGTAPVIQSSTSATSLTLGTNKTGATLALQSGAASSTMVLDSSGTNGDAVISDGATATARIGHYNSGTSYAAIWFLDAGSPSASNYSFLGNQSVTYLNSPALGGSIYFSFAGGVYVGITTNGLGLGADYSAAAPIRVDWGTPTTPVIQSSTSATSLTIGTNKSAAALQLQGDAAANVIKLTTAAEMQTQVVYDAVSSPSVPSATQITVYVDTLDNKLKAKDNAGNVTVLAP